MKSGTKVKDKHGDIGIIVEVFSKLIPIKNNKYHNSRRIIEAYLIKINDKHFIYRQRDDVKRI